jgi:hypothetical protein
MLDKATRTDTLVFFRLQTQRQGLGESVPGVRHGLLILTQQPLEALRPRRTRGTRARARARGIGAGVGGERSELARRLSCARRARLCEQPRRLCLFLLVAVQLRQGLQRLDAARHGLVATRGTLRGRLVVRSVGSEESAATAAAEAGVAERRAREEAIVFRRHDTLRLGAAQAALGLGLDLGRRGMRDELDVAAAACLGRVGRGGGKDGRCRLALAACGQRRDDGEATLGQTAVRRGVRVEAALARLQAARCQCG